MSITLASIHLYPVKSLGGFAVNEARLTDRGLEHDRRWMLVDEQGLFVSQREIATMACLHSTALPNGFRVTDIRNGTHIDLPWSLSAQERATVQVWDDRVESIVAPGAWSDWFSQRLQRLLTLVYMPDDSLRAVDPTYASGTTSFSDGFPYLIISQASLDALNARMAAPLPMDRFRPNLTIAGGDAFQEDGWRSIGIGTSRFELVKPCARCPIPTTDQRTGERGVEPLRTLATFRRNGNKVLFGMNAMGLGSGTVRTGDAITVHSTVAS